jgi:hypothetical protein
MLSVFLVLLLLALWGSPAWAQVGGPGTLVQTNDPTTGTLNGANRLAKLTPTGLMTATPADTAVPLYVVVAGAGNTGSALIQTSGTAPCLFDDDQNNTAGFFVVNSVKGPGLCHAVDKKTPPASGYVHGILTANSTTAGSQAAMIVTSINYIPGAQPPRQKEVRSCVLVLRLPGTTEPPPPPGSDDMPHVCPNNFLEDWTLTSVSCVGQGGTMTVLPVLRGGALTSVVQAPLTCSKDEWSHATLNGSPVVYSFTGTGKDRKCVKTPCTVDVRIQPGPVSSVPRYAVLSITGEL